MLADMATRTEAARQLLYAACDAIEAGDPGAARWASMAKLFAGDTAMAVTTDAVQVLGGYGYTTDFAAERMMRDAKITQLYEGTQQIQRLDHRPRPARRAAFLGALLESGLAATRRPRDTHHPEVVPCTSWSSSRPCPWWARSGSTPRGGPSGPSWKPTAPMSTPSSARSS